MKLRYSRAVKLSEQREVLRHHADPAFDAPGGVGHGQVGVQNPHRAAGGGQQAGKHLDGGRFARPVGTEKAEELSREPPSGLRPRRQPGRRNAGSGFQYRWWEQP